ncbi:hypothetical protein OSTOST_18069, partial [Ostertagia ostertagi]
AVNHCCVVHDVCYTHQLGQEQCDEEFCGCNRVSSPLDHIVVLRDCLDLLEASCSLVQLFGFGAYRHSANYTEPDDLVKHTLQSNSLNVHFEGIYQRCHNVNATLSSCALQHNLCEDSPNECAQTLSECLLDAASVDGSESCREAVALMSSAALNGEEPQRKKLSRQMAEFLQNRLFPRIRIYGKMLMGACLVALVYFVLRLRNATKFDEKSLKYSPV